MRAKKLTTAEGDGVLTVLKGGKHITSSIATDPKLNASAETSLRNWARPDCRIDGSYDSLNSENGSHILENGHAESFRPEGKRMCGNSSFLSRFIELRVDGGKLCGKMTAGSENGGDKTANTEEAEISALAQSACNEGYVGTTSSARVVDGFRTERVSPYRFDENSRAIAASLSRAGSEIEEKKVVVEICSSDKDRLTGDRVREEQQNVSAVRRHKDQVGNGNSGKETYRNGSSGGKNFTDGISATKSASGTKQDGIKLDARRIAASTRDVPPRKVSFRVRCGTNNGRPSSSCAPSTPSRRSSTLNKALPTDGRVPNLSSSKVAALTSKFNALIHENRAEKSADVVHDDPKKKPSICQLTSGLTSVTAKKPPSAEKVFLSRRNSSNSKREGFSSKAAGNTNIAYLGFTLRKHTSVKQPLIEADCAHRPPANGNTKDYKRRNNMAYRPSAPGTKSGCVKAAIEIFEKNATISPCAKVSGVGSEGKRKAARNCSTGELKEGSGSAEAKKQPKYPRVIFKRDAALVRVTLACEDVCNEERHSVQSEGKVSGQCRESSPSECDEVSEKCVEKCEEFKGRGVQGEDGREVMELGQNKTGCNEAKTKPTVPANKPSIDHIQKNAPLSENKSKDSKRVKGTCQQASVCGTTGVTKNTVAQDDKLEVPQNTLDCSGSSVRTPHTPEGLEESQHGDRESVAPNRSFLWGATVPVTNGCCEPTDRTGDSADDVYDDVCPPSAVCSNDPSSNHQYSVVQLQDDDVYDDVGPSTHDDKGCARAPTLMASVSTGTYDYCQEPSLDQNYDDCEGEGYQCIGDCNIYDDVKSETTLRVPDDVTSISNCYESIYGEGEGATTADGRASAVRRGGSSASSSIGNHSCCDQSNSLYGVGGSRFDSASVSQASTVSADYGPHEVLSYQLTPCKPRSETSDEWVDVEMTDSDGEEVYHGRARSRKSPRRSRKARKQWSKTARKAAGNLASGDHSSESDADHHYEMLYEVVGDAKNDPAPCDDFDSFDSDVSDDTYIKPLHQVDSDVANGRLPEPPPGQNIYGISKIAEAAGKKMLKLGKSLRKIRTKRSGSETGVEHKGTGTACPPLPTSPRPPPPSLPSPPVLPPRISEKSVSSGNLSGRKYWSLRKFKRSVSASDHMSLASLSSGPRKETATFYLTQTLDADTGSMEECTSRMSADATDMCLENGDMPTSPSSLGSGKTVVYDVGTEADCSSETSQRTVTSTTNTKKHRLASAPEGRNSNRPNSPPPLPPSSDVKKPGRKEKRVTSTTSWYAECGLFDRTVEVQNVGIMDTPKRTVKKQDRPVSNSWYAEVGLWEMSTSSANESSVSEQDARSQHTDLSGGDSPLTAGSPENSGVVERWFADEPLYQFYTAAVVERDMRSELDSDGYEEVGDGSRKPKSSRPTAMELIQPREGQHRTLWCEIPEVVNSLILSTISPHQKKLQEAKFEIITSEASYMNSLNVLEKHFLSSLETCDEHVLSKNDRRVLFANLMPVKTCSERFLAELEECWQDNILLKGICEVVYKHSTNNLNAYVKYCSNQICLDRTLRALKEQNTKFAEALQQLESNPVCQSLSLHSFLMLPMQRITRLPLLIDAVLTRLDQTDDEYSTCQLALATLNRIVQNCNEDARRMERMEEMLILSPQLYFPSEVKAIPIISSARWLVRKGELTQLVWRGDEGKLTFGKKLTRLQIHMFLFTDLLVITKKKRRAATDTASDESYAVMDYCPRNLVQMTSAEGMSNLPVKFTSDGGRNLVLLTMLQNHEKKTVEMVLSCSTESDQQRWLEAVSPPVSDNPDETVYEEWDCPQVIAVHPYVASQPDELSLEVADVVNVLRKMNDGWYQGERIRDSERGWFPGNYTSEVLSAHVRARNLKQRYRLLALSGNFLEAQRKEKQAK